MTRSDRRGTFGGERVRVGQGGGTMRLSPLSLPLVDVAVQCSTVDLQPGGHFFFDSSTHPTQPNSACLDQIRIGRVFVK